ncbi:flagellar export protein FliJ [Candidatus Laterigemmans baculatus]|uniref:flagellar export protein FliJ n=1 Tax=Candidatus Laterigemmans baculatus TaxID=2770505 RepID=UPI0013DAE843|nr:flagellar export protein FliJ [Candidatus Laterigemmans baculatus]
MARFAFRFEAILKLRHNERDAARLYVAEAQRALDILDERIAELQQDRQRTREEAGRAMVGHVTVEQLLSRGRYDLQLDAEQRDLVMQRRQIEVEVERRRQRLTVAEQECRKLERLREITAERFEAEQLRVQQDALDELATLRAARRGTAGSGSTWEKES